MKKWDVTIKFSIQAKTRTEAWELSKAICRDKLRDLANVVMVSSEALSERHADTTIAVNQLFEKLEGK